MLRRKRKRRFLHVVLVIEIANVLVDQRERAISSYLSEAHSSELDLAINLLSFSVCRSI